MKQFSSVRGHVSGRVQGVGFRYFVLRHAQAENIAGFACNLEDGRVEFLLQGETEAVTRLLAKIRLGPDYAQVSNLQYSDCAEVPGIAGFVIR